MPIQHIYEKVSSKNELPSDSYQILLEGGTSIRLDGILKHDFESIQAGDQILVDQEYSAFPETSSVFVFRNGSPITMFGVSKDYVQVQKQ